MPLVFPRSKPLGANHSRAQDAISEDSTFPTKVVDYLKFEIFDSKKKQLIDDGTIYLYLPAGMKETYGVKYNGVELGFAGNAAVTEAGKIIESGGEIDEGFGERMKQAASSGKSALLYGAASKVISGSVGLSGVGNASNLGANDVSALLDQKIFNPYEKAIFAGVSGFRSHNFNFNLVPKSSQDVSDIYRIVDTLRMSMLPGVSSQNKWLTIPEYFKISIVRYTDNGNSETIQNPRNGARGGMLNLLMQFPTDLVLKNMSVDFANDTLQTTNETQDLVDFGPSAYRLSLAFQETSYLTKESFAGFGRGQGMTLNATGGHGSDPPTRNSVMRSRNARSLGRNIGDFFTNSGNFA